MTENEFREKTLAAITTYGRPGLIDLSCTKLRSYGLHCAVFDDGSMSDALKAVCDKHHVYLSGLYKRRKDVTDAHVASRMHACGDILSTVDAMNYAIAYGYQFVIKLSRSWICLDDPIPSLHKLYEESEGSTFTNYTTSYGMGFRTECIAYNMDHWGNVMHKLAIAALHDKDIGLVEAYMHNYARKLQPNSDKYQEFIDKQESGPVAGSDSYIHWDWMGTDKCNCPRHILWHDSNKPAEYVKACRDCGLNQYTEEDFKHTGPVEELMYRK